jgi:hypothetical protein
MHVLKTFVAGCLILLMAQVACASPLPLFTSLKSADTGGMPLPEDSLALWDSALDITGLAGMPNEVAVSIPRQDGDVSATIRLESMDRREGFGERDADACVHGDPRGCEIIPYPDFPAESFSYTWIGQGDGYDLRLTVHHGHAVGVLSGPQGRFAIAWDTLKELRQAYFRTDDSFVYDAKSDPADAQAAAPISMPATKAITAMTPAAAQAATVAKIQSKTQTTATTQLDMLVLFTEEARVEAGGDPYDCRDTDGVMTYVYQNVDSMNTAFQRSLIPAQIGTVTVTRLTGYALIPFNYSTYDPTSITTNLRNIQQNANIESFRDLVGADVVSTLVDTQTNLGVCGASYIQRQDCGGIAAPSCGMGPLFSDWTYLLETVECSKVDTLRMNSVMYWVLSTTQRIPALLQVRHRSPIRSAMAIPTPVWASKPSCRRNSIPGSIAGATCNSRIRM